MLPRPVVALFLVLAVCNAYKILVYSPKMAHSHVTFLGNIADILVDAGNDVTVLMPDVQPAVRTNGTKKAKVIIVDMDDRIKKLIDFQEMWLLQAFKDQEEYAKLFCEELVSKTELLEWIKNEKFEVVISEAFDPCFIGTYKALNIKAHIIASATFLFETVAYAAGVPFPPSSVPSSFSGLTDRMTFVDRMKNLLGTGVIHWWLGGVIGVHQSIIDQHYGKGFSNIMVRSK
uniref:glucuronosyltransferase n=1 Tax=Steinernema glaseri TaxID=37863 RepID=A0A1I7YZD0_9BILA